ncbi:MAG: response regulator [Desulfobacterales bacterium]|nr:response regulator [Desulfobacterales bacterium]
MSEKILLIDDEKEFVETLAERMKIRGIDVTATTSPVDALSKLDEETYDAIILDLKMPEMDGLEALAAMKEKNPELQIILLTGHATVEKGIEAMKLGAMDFLEKPIDLKVLSEKIKKAQAKKMILVEKHTEEKIKQIIVGKGFQVQ